MGAIIKKFGKKTAKHMADTKVRHKSWKKMGLKGPKYKIGKKVKGSHHLDEVWTFDKNYPKGKAEGGRIGFKQGGAYGPLRGTTAGGVAKAFRGKAGFKESQALQKKLKPHITGKRSIGEVTYTKPAWKGWKKTKSKQYKRGESFKKKTSEALEAKHPGFKKIATKNFPSFLKSAATKAKGGRA